MYTLFIFTNSRIPKRPNSLPKPDCLIPPKGNLGSERTYSFTKQQPARQSRRGTASEIRSDSTAESEGSPIVGIGASAGGFEAISELLQHLSPKTGMAYVFIQ